MKIEKSSPFGNIEIVISLLLVIVFSAFSIFGLFKNPDSFIFEKYISLITVPVEVEPVSEPEPVVYFTEEGVQNLDLTQIQFVDFKKVSFNDFYLLEQYEKQAVDALVELKKSVEDMKLLDEKGKNFAFIKEADRINEKYEKLLETKEKFGPANCSYYLKKNAEFIKNLQDFRKKYYDHKLFDAIVYSDKIKEWNKTRVWKKLCGDFSTEEIAFRVWNDWDEAELAENGKRFGYLGKCYLNADRLCVLFNEILLDLVPPVSEDIIPEEEIIIPSEPYFNLFHIISFEILALLVFVSSFFTRKIEVKKHDMLFVLVSVAGLLIGFTFFLLCYKFDIVGASIFVLLNLIYVLVLRNSNRRFYIKVNREKLLQYMSDKAAAQILAEPEKYNFEAKEQICTALVTGIENYNGFITSLAKAKEKTKVMKEYFEAIEKAVQASDGIFDKMDGDSSVSIFGVPFGYKNHAYRACVAAINIKKAESDFNKKHMIEENLKEAFKTRIGINSGSMIAGNLGTENKSNFSVVGENSEIAKKMVQVNKMYGTSILCTEETWSSVDFGERKGEIAVKKMDRIKINGKENPVQFYSIIGFSKELTKQQQEDISLFNEAVELYWSRKFVEAGKLFLKANEIFPEDKAALIFAERCKKCLTNPVQENWDGVLDLNNYFSM